MRSGLALASLVLGIFSFVQLMGLEKGALAIVFGAFALKEIKKEKLTGNKLAFVGIALGVISVVLTAVVLVFYWDLIMQITAVK